MSEASGRSTASRAGSVDIRMKIAALWAANMFIYVYVDIFGFFRADVINGVIAGKVGAFQIDQTFLLLTTIYVVLPSLMIPMTLMLKASISRWANLVLSLLYAASVVAAGIGETWLYYLAGSAIEVLLMLAIVWLSWTWPRPE